MMHYPHKIPRGKVNLGHPILRRCIGLWLLNESGGVDILDHSGSNAHGVLTGITPSNAWTTTRFGKGLRFSATGHYVNCGTRAQKRMSRSFLTVAVWCQPEALSNEKTICGANNVAENTFEIVTSESPNVYGFRLKGVVWSGRHGDQAVGRLVYVVGKYDGSEQSIYIDGEKRGTIAASGLFSDRSAFPFSIGNDANNPASVFPGIVNQVIMWDRALQDDEIRFLARDPWCFMRHEPIVLTSVGAPPIVRRSVIGGGVGTSNMTISS